MMHPLFDIHSNSGIFLAGQMALRDSNTCMNYRVLYERVNKLANYLKSIDGNVVAMKLQNSIDWVVIDLACQFADMVCLPLPGFFTTKQQAYIIDTAGADILLTEDHLATGLNLEAIKLTKLEIPIPLTVTGWKLKKHHRFHDLKRPEGTQKITFTSGSTGTPKGVCLGLAHQWQVAYSLQSLVAMDRPRHLCLLPLPILLENVAGVYTTLLSGGTILLPDSNYCGLGGSSQLNLQALTECMDFYNPDSVILLPQILTALITACRKGWKVPSSLKFAAVGGARVSPEIIEDARQCHIPVFEGYGLSECGSVVAVNSPGNDKPGSVGKPLPHCQLRIDNNEIIVSCSCHLGYLAEPESWYPESVSTGDLGYLDSGYLYINGRSKNLLISSFGRNISPEWVESKLYANSLLSHCIVAGDGKPYLVAVVSAADSVTDEKLENWIQQVNDRLPDYARIGAWQRLTLDAWRGYITANGRPMREKFINAMGNVIDSLYEFKSNYSFG
jgi:long-chain acyl-CoA synthetase